MRIAFVTPGFSSSDSNWCIPALQNLAVGLNANNDVQVYATCFPFESRVYDVKGVMVKSFGNGKLGRLPWTRRQWRAFCALKNDHRIAPFDLVHGFWADGGGVVAAMLRRASGVPVLASVMAGELTFEPQVGYGKARRPIAGRLARFGARHADTLLANSSWHADRITASCPGLEPQPMLRGVDIERFRTSVPRQDLDGEVSILMVGSLVPVKGHAIVLHAFAAALKRNAGLHLHVVGQGELDSVLKRQVVKLGIDSSVTFHGHVEHDRLPAYYRGASFCILASYFEGHGNVVLEAAACGRATIGTGVGYMPEFCNNEMLSQPGDAVALAASIENFSTNTALRESMSVSVLNRVNTKHTLSHSIDALEGLYAQAIANVAGSR